MRHGTQLARRGQGSPYNLCQIRIAPPPPEEKSIGGVTTVLLLLLGQLQTPRTVNRVFRLYVYPARALHQFDKIAELCYDMIVAGRP